MFISLAYSYFFNLQSWIPYGVSIMEDVVNNVPTIYLTAYKMFVLLVSSGEQVFCYPVNLTGSSFLHGEPDKMNAHEHVKKQERLEKLIVNEVSMLRTSSGRTLVSHG